MKHVAIDLGSQESEFCVRSEDGTIVEEFRWRTADIERRMRRYEPSRVIVETCTESFAIADALRGQNHDVRVVPASLVRTLGVGARKTKTDRRDARVLSEVSCRIELPSVHVASMEARERKAQCNMRDALVQSRTQLVNSVRTWLRGNLVRLRTGAIKSFPKRVRDKLLSTPLGLPSYVERLLLTIDELNTQIAAATKEIEQLTKEDQVCRRLMTVPGVGPIVAMRFVSTLDDIGRFDDAHAVESYLGLTPGENSSGQRQRRTSITKAGPSAARWTLIQGCWTLMRCRPKDPLVLWAKRVEQRRGKAIAVVALARKLAGVLYAIWRDQTVYNPVRAAMPPQPN